MSREGGNKGQYLIEPSFEISEFIEKINKLSYENFPIDQVLRLLQKEAPTLAMLEPYIFFSNARYTRNLIHKAPDFDLLLLCWGPGQHSPVHGHEGQKCWMKVLDGRLEFTDYQEEPPHERRLLSPLTVNIGEAGYVDGPAGIHAVGNAFDIPAISLHLYALPFEQCDVYNLDLNEKHKVSLTYHTIHGKIVAPEELR
ncbi:cysteine dioxygenase family protein [Candidatus Babeliales bacterium]|nr:cysteine dioxygenase family protein [Candidatus Babeliales bacterium]